MPIKLLTHFELWYNGWTLKHTSKIQCRSQGSTTSRSAENYLHDTATSIFVAGTEEFWWSKSPTVAMFASPDHFCAIINHLSQEGSIHPANTEWKCEAWRRGTWRGEEGRSLYSWTKVAIGRERRGTLIKRKVVLQRPLLETFFITIKVTSD